VRKRSASAISRGDYAFKRPAVKGRCKGYPLSASQLGRRIKSHVQAGNLVGAVAIIPRLKLQRSAHEAKRQ